MLLGVDGGGTKTDVVVADADGVAVATARVGCTNHETVGMPRAVAVLETGVREALAAAGVPTGAVRASVFGLAGVDWPSDERRWHDALGAWGLGGERSVVNDSRLALRAGASTGWGIVSCVGTGSITAGLDPSGRWFRTMSVGWGEPCGASSLVADALHAIAAAHHRTAPPTSLTERFLHALGSADVSTLFEAISHGTLIPGPSLAPAIDAASADGDAVAAAILDRSGSDHAAMVVGVADHLHLADTPFELVTAGGVHTGAIRFGESFARRIRSSCPQATITPLDRPPVAGTMHAMAGDLAG